MKSFFRIVLLGVAMASSAALAAPAAELRVGGTIRPGACVPSFGAAAHANFGTISSATFHNRRRVALEAMAFQFSITCDVRTRVGVTPHDNQAHSVDRDASAELTGEHAANPEDMFGLGSDSGRNLGGYVARFVPGSFVADGQQVDTLSAPNEGGAWVRRRGGQIRHGVTNSWAEKGSTTPGSFTNISGMLRIRPVVNAMDEIKQDANLDGSLTLELDYL